MGIEQRRHIRFSLDIPAIRYTRYGEAMETLISQISIGGCLAEWEDSVYVGDEFRLLIQLPNKNFLPLTCKVMYKFSDNGIGIKFLDVTQFEQELLAKIISNTLENQGFPLQVDPFAQPKKPAKIETPKITDSRQKRDEILEDILSVSGK
ncbi:MAG: PilZ domain-containing protein [Acidobacteriota bacterium]|nr:PilZ domain-containing protein [Acidobacteriota bacterium]